MTFKLNHVHLKTTDPDKTAKFYVDTLGAKIVSQSANGGYRIDLHGLSLNVTPFLESEKLKAQGIHILEQTVVSGGRRVCFFEGPDGVQLEFIEMKG